MIIWGTGNLPMGGENNSIFGMILVTYPENSVLSIAGGYALRKDLSYTKRLYYVKSEGSYTITSTNIATSETVNKVVTISTYGQSTSIELIYPIWLIKNGKCSDQIIYTMLGPDSSNFEENEEGGYMHLTTAGAASTYSTVYFEGLDLSKFNSIVFDGQAAGYYNASKHCPAVGSLTTPDSGASNSVFNKYNLLSKATSKNYTTRAESVVDITEDNTASANVGFQCAGTSSNKVPGGIMCYNLYLTNIDAQ